MYNRGIEIYHIDDVELRQAIEKQLSKIENSNKFNKAICVGEEEFQHGTKEEMDAVDACRRIIKSAHSFAGT